MYVLYQITCVARKSEVFMYCKVELSGTLALMTISKSSNKYKFLSRQLNYLSSSPLLIGVVLYQMGIILSYHMETQKKLQF